MSMQLAREGNARRARFYAPRQALIAAEAAQRQPRDRGAPPKRDWLILGPTRRSDRVAEIQAAVARHFDLTVVTLMAPRRSRLIVVARHTAMWITDRRVKTTLREIGIRFGHRDHSTVANALRVVDRMRAADKAFAAEIDTIIASLKLEAE